MTKRNYKVYGDLSLDFYRMFRVLSTLNTCAGPNFVRRTELPDEMERCIRHRPLPDICDANSKPTPMVGTVKLPVKLGHFLVHFEFILWGKISAPVFSVVDFCDRYPETRRPRKKLADLEKGSAVPFLIRPMKRNRTLPPLPPE